LSVEHPGVVARVVETIMIFALGFLAATLIALLIIPAINARADRLARRRAEALFPLSISELTAEKDHLRAEFAVMQRKIERKAEEAQALKHQTMEELGRRAVRIHRLEADVAERDGAIGDLQADLAETRSRLASAEEDLAETRATLSATRETLVAVENAHRRTLDELASTREDLERTSTTLAGIKAELMLAQDREEAREAALADLDGRLTTALNDLDAKRITVSDLETRLAMQTGRGNDFERALGDRRIQLDDERNQIAELAKALLAEQERGMTLESRIRELEQELQSRQGESVGLGGKIPALSSDGPVLGTSLDERPEAVVEPERGLEETGARVAVLQAATGHTDEAPAEVRVLSERVEDLRAAKASLEGALATAREERARLERELHRLRRTGGSSDEIKAENAELRRLITEVADSFLTAAGSEAPDAPADQTEASAANGRRKAAG